MQTFRVNAQKAGGIAAFLNALLAGAALIVAFGLIGPAALADSVRLIELAVTNPAPLILQDVLKIASAGVALVVVAALHARFREASPTAMGWATAFGMLAIVCLLANASLSLYAVSQATYFAQGQPETGRQLNGLVGLLGMAVIAINGLWYLLVNWVALRAGSLPRRLSGLGLALGGLSLLPPLGVIVLTFSVIWSAWLGWALLRDRRPARNFVARHSAL